MKKFSKNAMWHIVAAICAVSFILGSCGKSTDSFSDDNEVTTDDTTVENGENSEKETEAETEPELTDVLPKEFDEEDIRDELTDIFYDENYDLIRLFDKDEIIEVTTTRAESYVGEFRVIAEGTICGKNEFRDYTFDFVAEFERFSHNNRWGLSECELTYTGEGPKGFDIGDAELQIENKLGYDVDITGYTENDDGSCTVTYDYVNPNMFAPICIKYSGNTAKYLPFAHCSDVWYIDTFQNGNSSFAYMDKTFGTFSLTDGDLTLNFTIADDAVDFYGEYGYYSLDYTVTHSDGTVHESFATVSPVANAEYNDWDNNDTYTEFWHSFVFDTGKGRVEFSYRAYKNNGELSGWYIEDTRLTEN